MTAQAEARPDAGQAPPPSDRSFLVILVAIAALVLYVFLWHGITAFTVISANLPLLLPLAVTVLSVFTRAADIRSSENVLKISNDIAIGIISFDIWALSASRSDPAGRIMVNSDTMISGDFVLPFLLAGLLIAVGCVVLTNYSFKSQQSKQRWLLVGLVAAVVVYIAPFGVKRPATGESAGKRTYAVVIPYQDSDITSMAPSLVRERRFFAVEEGVRASNDSTAAELGVRRFLASSVSDRARRRPGEKVTVSTADVLVIPR